MYRGGKRESYDGGKRELKWPKGERGREREREHRCRSDNKRSVFKERKGKRERAFYLFERGLKIGKSECEETERGEER